MFCLVVGSPIDGLRVYGPFDDHDLALSVAEQGFRDEPWFITSLDDWQGEDVDNFEMEAYSQ